MRNPSQSRTFPSRDNRCVFFAKLQIEVFSSEARFGEWMLRRHAAIIFYLDLEILARKNSLSEIEYLRERFAT